MKKFLYLPILLILSLVPYSYSRAESTRLTLLKDIHVKTSVDKTRIELRFNGTPKEKGMSFHENFIQVEFYDTYIDPAKQWIDVEDETVKNIFLYQFDETTVRARLFTTGKGWGLKDRVRLLRKDDKIVITYNKESIERVGAAGRIIVPPDPEEKKEGKEQKEISPPVPDPVNAETETSQSIDNIPETSVSPSTEKAKNTRVERPLFVDGPGSPDLYVSLMKMILALSILLALLLGGLYLFKRYMGKKIGIAGRKEGIKIVTSAYIGPKKSIALVDISGERIVVGITPNHISMLARLGRDGEFGKILEEQISSDDRVELHDDLWEKV